MTSCDPKPSYFELIAVLVVGALHIVMELSVSQTAAQLYNATVSVLFISYLVWRAVTCRGILRYWGMRRDNFWSALAAQVLFAIPAAAFVVCCGIYAGTLPLPTSFWTILVLYPLWGTGQQFALQNLVGANLVGLIRPRVWHAFVTAAVFSVAHFPNYPLMGLTLAAGFFFTRIYRRHPNLWAVGILHGLLGALAYYLVLGEDPGEVLRAFLVR